VGTEGVAQLCPRKHFDVEPETALDESIFGFPMK